jgi:hypothetical protein
MPVVFCRERSYARQEDSYCEYNFPYRSEIRGVVKRKRSKDER